MQESGAYIKRVSNNKTGAKIAIFLLETGVAKTFEDIYNLDWEAKEGYFDRTIHKYIRQLIKLGIVRKEIRKKKAEKIHRYVDDRNSTYYLLEISSLTKLAQMFLYIWNHGNPANLEDTKKFKSSSWYKRQVKIIEGSLKTLMEYEIPDMRRMAGTINALSSVSAPDSYQDILKIAGLDYNWLDEETIPDSKKQSGETLRKPLRYVSLAYRFQINYIVGLTVLNAKRNFGKIVGNLLLSFPDSAAVFFHFIEKYGISDKDQIGIISKNGANSSKTKYVNDITDCENFFKMMKKKLMTEGQFEYADACKAEIAQLLKAVKHLNSSILGEMIYALEETDNRSMNLTDVSLLIDRFLEGKSSNTEFLATGSIQGFINLLSPSTSNTETKSNRSRELSGWMISLVIAMMNAVRFTELNSPSKFLGLILRGTEPVKIERVSQ